MKDFKIYWVKQKLFGFGLLLAMLIFANLLVEYEAGITFVVLLPIAIQMMFSKKMYLSSDYIYEFKREEKRS